jgi:hypothetical protein
MATAIEVHDKADVEFSEIGSLRFVNGQLVIANVNVAERVAAQAGVLEGGRRRGVLRVTFHAVSMANVDSDGTMGGHFAEFGGQPDAA